MAQQPHIGKALFLAIPRLAKKEICLGLLEAHREGGSEIRENADEDHLDVGERLGEAEEHVDEDGHELGEGAGGEEVWSGSAEQSETVTRGKRLLTENGLLEVLKAETTRLDTLDNGRELVEEDQIGGLHRDLGSTSHGDSNVGLLESSGVVDSISRDGDGAAGGLIGLDDLKLLLRRSASEDDLVEL